MIPQGLHAKRLLIQSIGVQKSGGNIFQSLLDGLSIKELGILQKHDDLSSRVATIAKMTEAALLAAIKDDYNLDPVDCHTGDVWIATDLIEENIPKWFESQHCGWYLSFRGGDFTGWARTFLMQEVRINIWIRYLEHKKKNPTKQRCDDHYGMYL